MKMRLLSSVFLEKKNSLNKSLVVCTWNDVVLPLSRINATEQTYEVDCFVHSCQCSCHWWSRGNLGFSVLQRHFDINRRKRQLSNCVSNYKMFLQHVTHVTWLQTFCSALTWIKERDCPAGGDMSPVCRECCGWGSGIAYLEVAV